MHRFAGDIAVDWQVPSVDDVLGLLGSVGSGSWTRRVAEASLQALEEHAQTSGAHDNWLGWMFWRLGVEVGWVMQALYRTGTVWGYFIDHDEVCVRGWWVCAPLALLVMKHPLRRSSYRTVTRIPTTLW